MSLDLVHDIQKTYRKLLDGMSRPGKVLCLKEQAAHMDMEMISGVLPVTRLAMIMLLDTEVTFKVISTREEQVSNYIHQLTYAKAEETDRADFIFILQDAAEEQLDEAIRRARLGTLTDPHQSATLWIEVDSVTEGPKLRLTGPGIETEQIAEMSVRSQHWLELLEHKNREYPLGIELVFVDTQHRAVCLPRTTQITKAVMD